MLTNVQSESSKLEHTTGEANVKRNFQGNQPFHLEFAGSALLAATNLLQRV